MRAVVYAIRRSDGLYYTHGYPSGTWEPFPKFQMYQTKSAATRQANKLTHSEVVVAQVTCEEEL